MQAPSVAAVRILIVFGLLCVESCGPRLPLPRGAVGGDTWDPISTVGAPSPRYTTPVWTGSELLVGGGGVDGNAHGDGARYNPATTAWRPIMGEGAPSPRLGGEMIWTGSELLIWGGEGQGGPLLGDGARYDPQADRWRPISSVGAPSPRIGEVAAWTGSELLIWGGHDLGNQRRFADGGRYDPHRDTWSPLPAAGTPIPQTGQVAVWIGSELLVWGGSNDQGKGVDAGARYNPQTNRWSPVPASNLNLGTYGAPVWTGSELLIWGGLGPNGAGTNTGARYDPRTGAWKPISTVGAPGPRWLHAAVWTGRAMIIWVGVPGFKGDDLQDGALYDPKTDTWRTIASTGAPSPRVAPAVWTGREFLIWGGAIAQYGKDTPLGDGAAYQPPAQP